MAILILMNDALTKTTADDMDTLATRAAAEGNLALAAELAREAGRLYNDLGMLDKSIECSNAAYAYDRCAELATLN